MGQLSVVAEQTARSTPEGIWELISDATRYPGWGPWSAAGYRNGDGTRIRWEATWDETMAGRLVWRGLRTFFPGMLTDLVAAAEKQPGT